MATYLLSTITDGEYLDFDPAVDQLTFDDPGVSAASLTVIDAGEALIIMASTGAATKTFTLLNVSLAELSSSYVSFADGSVWLVGDDSTGTVADYDGNTLVGSANGDYLQGLDGADSLDGGSGKDILDGGLGNDNDTLVGGLGDDTYIVDVLGDLVQEDVGAGVDTVHASITYTLAVGSNLENLTLTGYANINGTGNELDNWLTGNEFANVLTGSTGNDTLYGSGGIDTLIGGSGDDSYFADSAAEISETIGAGGGEDTVYVSWAATSEPFVLGLNLENISLQYAIIHNATGNTVDNVITGNGLDNLLDGGAGNDIILGDDTLTGGTGNDTLIGGAGNDTLDGGEGDDTYEIDVNDVLIETAGHGRDTVKILTSTDLTTFNTDHDVEFENITLLGTVATYAYGNAVDNRLVGNASANTLTGYDGNDTLEGGLGSDSLTGGLGDDVYIVENRSEINEFSDQGNDTIVIGASYAIALGDVSVLENIQLSGTGNFTATGSSLDNRLAGNAGNNTLTGGGGDDTLIGGGGTDIAWFNGYMGDYNMYSRGGDLIVQDNNLADGDDGTDTLTGITTLRFSDGTLTGRSMLEFLVNTTTAGDQEGGLLVAVEGGFTIHWAGQGVDLTRPLHLQRYDNTGAAIGGETDMNFTVTNQWSEGSALSLSNGGYMLVGRPWKFGDIYYQRFSDTSAAIGPEVKVDTTASPDLFAVTVGTSIQIDGNPVLSNLGNGGFVVVWGEANMTRLSGLDEDDMPNYLASEGQTRVLARFYDASGTAVSSSPIQINASNLDPVNGINVSDSYAWDQSDLVATHTGDGGVLVVWRYENTSLAPGRLGLLGRVFEADGTARTGEFVVDGQTTFNIDDQRSMDAATYRHGSVVAYSESQIAPYAPHGAADGSLIKLRFFDEQGAVVGLEPVNAESSTLTNYAEDREAHVASLLDGGFVVVWQRVAAGVSDQIFGRRYDADGVAVGNEFQVDFNSGFVSNWDYWQDIDVAGLDSGGFAVTWNADGMDGSGVGVFAQVFDSGGHKLGFRLSGGSTNDTLIWNAAGTEAVLLDGGAGNDEVGGGVGDDKVAGGLGNDTLMGNGGADLLTGGDGNDILDGGSGDNRLQGDLGTDIAVLSGSAADYFINVLSPGSDGRIYYDLGFGLQPGDIVNLVSQDGRIDRLVNVERVHFLGADGIFGTGDDQEIAITPEELLINVSVNRGEGYFADSTVTNILYGTINNDVLDGLGGNDLLAGLSGNDVLLGGEGNDTLEGGLGNDALSGQAGDDTLAGGAGNDNYIVDAGDTVIENLDEGTADRIQTGLSAYTLARAANVEILEYTGSLAFSGAGNAGNNLLIGGIGNDVLDGGAGADQLLGRGGDDSLLGGDGNDILDGGTGNDTLSGGADNDVYFVDSQNDVVVEAAASGEDRVDSSVSYVLSADVESLVLGGAGNLNGSGNASDNRIVGNSGQNILDGGAGNDTLLGGGGNDTYVIDSVDDVVDETGGSGIDTIQTSLASFALSASSGLIGSLENLVFSGAGDASGLGNALANRLTGNVGNDTLDGGAGNDTLTGGGGNDAYLVDSTTDVIIENSAEGNDTAWASVSYTLAANVENLFLTGTAAINGTGNAGDNQITGNSAANLLTAGAGNDTIDGGLGSDTLVVSGLRTDYRFERLDEAGTSVLMIHNGSGETDTLAGIERIRFGNLVEAQLSLGDLLLNTASAYADNYLGGDLSNDSFDGLAGNDTINGRGGNDNLLGNAGNDSLTGGLGNDTLDGGTGTDTLIGGAGNDVYVFDDVGDTLTENANEGTDTLRTAFNTTLAGAYANLENLVLLGTALNATGNDLANMLTGNAEANTLSGGAGNDTLDGGSGTDTLIGGSGDDIYTMDDIGDVITENAGEGTDTLYISIHNTGAPIILTAPANIETILFSANALGVTLATNGSGAIQGGSGNNDSIAFTGGGSYTLPAGIENLQLTQSTGNIGGTGGADNNLLEGNSGANLLDGGAGNDTLKGYAGEDILLGGSGNDLLNGGKGADRLEGGFGDDTYVIDNSGDQIIEALGAGTDTVRSSLRSTTLGDNLENLVLEGTAKANGIGNALNNQLTGNAKANCLTGGAGADTFIFNTTLSPLNVDTLTDFTTGQDKIALDDSIFTTLSGASNNWYHSVTSLAQTDADDRIVYNASTGALYYDADGAGGAAAIRFAMLTGAPTLSAADLQVV